MLRAVVGHLGCIVNHLGQESAPSFVGRPWLGHLPPTEHLIYQTRPFPALGLWPPYHGGNGAHFAVEVPCPKQQLEDHDLRPSGSGYCRRCCRFDSSFQISGRRGPGRRYNVAEQAAEQEPEAPQTAENALHPSR
ncbi:hypothetical protein CH63R_14577 [Colletotrichum higginsianum IMI 349063]|uniref:Uncharacterized protein n=1 Tax=Colletotrichum higginsianum (strain IMI 349063) TaxID=759273 RepID=A0A1B7XQG3_COLHI|nr:hypothetical protein CH63R_14577 [Colletotrichum higginsianum IMI 349063]OBR02005.1 hypothetical protein CH63R_14577 [Colletotrichum higginsianum IMI 349063]